MTLRGARLAVMEEFPELGHLNVKRLKDLLGTGEITARYCGKDTVTWKPTHSVFVSTNYLPRVDESDHGTWRRLALVDFPYRYRQADEQIRTSVRPSGRSEPARASASRPRRPARGRAGVAGRRSGAVVPHGQVMPADPRSVREATQAWRRTSDLLMRYMDDRLVFDNGSHVVATELFDDFTHVAEGQRTRGLVGPEFQCPARPAQRGGGQRGGEAAWNPRIAPRAVTPTRGDHRGHRGGASQDVHRVVGPPIPYLGR